MTENTCCCTGCSYGFDFDVDEESNFNKLSHLFLIEGSVRKKDMFVRMSDTVPVYFEGEEGLTMEEAKKVLKKYDEAGCEDTSIYDFNQRITREEFLDFSE